MLLFQAGFQIFPLFLLGSSPPILGFHHPYSSTSPSFLLWYWIFPGYIISSLFPFGGPRAEMLQVTELIVNSIWDHWERPEHCIYCMLPSHAAPRPRSHYLACKALSFLHQPCTVIKVTFVWGEAFAFERGCCGVDSDYDSEILTRL